MHAARELVVFALNNASVKLQKVMDWVLASLDFSKCYIENIIVFNSTMEGHI
jgi:hypothetical protein